MPIRLTGNRFVDMMNAHEDPDAPVKRTWRKKGPSWTTMAQMDGIVCAMFDHRPAPSASIRYRHHFSIGWAKQTEIEGLRHPPRICSWCGGSFRSAVITGLCPRCEGRFKAEHQGFPGGDDARRMDDMGDLVDTNKHEDD